MPSWITIYCRKSVAALSAEQVRAGMVDQDPSASAGADYLTLAESYDVDEAEVKPALANLRVSGEGLDLEVQYREAGRPIVVHHWATVGRVKEELEEALEVRAPPESVRERLAQTTEIVALELGFSMLEDMGVVLAYELARYIAQKGDGLIVDDDNVWQDVDDGAFRVLE
jgi:hypothetical protein